MKIAFHDNSLSLRGTTVAIYDWAYWTRHYLGVDPIIMYDENHPPNSIDAINKFKKEFPVFSYSNKSEIDKILSEMLGDKPGIDIKKTKSLDKIAKNGYSSLTAHEKRLLFELSNKKN